MFNKNVTDVLQQVNAMTNSVILKYPVTVAVSESQDMMMSVNISNLDSESFPDIGLKDSLSDFLSLFKLFSENREVNIDNNVISISDGSKNSQYISDNIALMDAYNKDPEQITKTENVPSVASFDMSTQDMKDLKSASAVFKDLDEIIIVSQDGDIQVKLGSTNKFNAKSNTYSLDMKGTANKNFEIKIPVDNFKMIPVSEYTFNVKYNSNRDAYRVLLDNKTVQGIKVLMSVKV